MGVSGDLQYILPICLLIVLCKFIVIDFKRRRYKIHVVLGFIIYSFIKLYILRYFNFDSNLRELTVFMTVFILIYLIFEFYILKNNKEIKPDILLEKAKVGYIYGTGLILIPIIIKIFNINIYSGEIKNYYLILFESFLSGVIYLLISNYGIKKMSREITKDANRFRV